MAKSILQKHYFRILTQWPQDILRPEQSFQTSILQRRMDRVASQQQQQQQQTQAKDKPAPASGPASASTAASATTPVAPATGTRLRSNEGSKEDELQQINVLYSLLENRYLKKYPLSSTTMTPLSNPTYYADLLQEIEEAPRRSKWEAMLNRWKGFLRFS